MNLCDINELRPMLARHGFHFSKSLGQNFLVDDSVPEAIAHRAGVDEQTGVLEIGPGVGTLTAALAKKAGKVLALELDRRLLPVLGETLAGCKNVEVVHADALKADLSALCREHLAGLRPAACANLPYYITSPAISALLDADVFDTVTVMVQKEVAQRLTAAPGSRHYGSFTVYVQYRCEASILLDVASAAFYPQPKVDSAVVHLKRRAAPPAVPADEKLFWEIVRASFAQRRKTLLNALSASFHTRISRETLGDAIRSCALSPSARGETLSIADFARLSDEFGPLFSRGDD